MHPWHVAHHHAGGTAQSHQLLDAAGSLGYTGAEQDMLGAGLMNGALSADGMDMAGRSTGGEAWQ